MTILCRNGIMGMKFKFFSKDIALLSISKGYKLVSGRQLSKAFSGFEFVFQKLEYSQGCTN